jgi:dipeptidyl-peptidase-3
MVKPILILTITINFTELFGQLLRETQRIKSEGDFEAVQALVEGYGVKVDQEIHAEVLERNKQFKSAPYGGFCQPCTGACNR